MAKLIHWDEVWGDEIKDLTKRCDFCKDKDAELNFGKFGLGICFECLEAIRG